MKFDDFQEIEKFVQSLAALGEKKKKFVLETLGFEMDECTISNFIVSIDSENNFRSGFMETDSKKARIYFGHTECYLRSKMFNAELEDFYQMVEIDKCLGLYNVRDTVYLLLYYFNFDIIIESNIVQVLLCRNSCMKVPLEDDHILQKRKSLKLNHCRLRFQAPYFPRQVFLERTRQR